ncbi:MAG: cupin domain-containing protein [Candidatus Diapherotrites archaeon]|nr:cupin domain-containing protein [Candidatus Diapherotrites archaeon]
MKVIRNPNWIEGKGEMKYKKRILMENVPPSVNLIEDVVIPPGGKIPSHAHKATTELFYITSGKARMKVQNKEFEVNPKDMVLVEVGESHSFINNSDEDFEMIVLKINFRKDDAILYEVKK